MTKVLSNLLGNTIREELYETESRLRVLASIKLVIFAVNKDFSLCANYPKGHGNLFRDCIETYHPGALLLHFEIVSGSHQDLVVEGSGEMYTNRLYCIEFLDEHLRTPGDNILQENIFIILSSLEMMALARLCVIINITIYQPTRWLADNCHIFDHYNCFASSMGRMVDELETALEDISEEGGLILKEEFMMLIFQEIINELPPFEKYWTYMFQNNSMPVVG